MIKITYDAMKIAMIGQKGIPASFGGVERHVEELSTRLVRLGHEVVVYSRLWYTQSREPYYKGVRVILQPSIRTKHLDTITHILCSTLSALRSDADVIHYHGVGPALVSWIPRVFKPRVRVVTTFHCIDRKHQKWGWFARLALWVGEWCALSFAHKTIVVSRTLETYCREVYGKDVTYVPNGFSSFDMESDDSVLSAYGLAPGHYFLAVSRFVRHKGLHYLIDAYRRMHTDKKLVLVGDAHFTSEYARELKRRADGCDKIIFLGWQTGNTLASLYRNAYLVVQPSETEGLSIVALEALGNRTAVLASDIPVNREIIENEIFLFANKSVSNLYDRLEYLVQHPDEVSREASERYHFVRTSYDWDVIACQVFGVYGDDWINVGVREVTVRKV